MPTFNSMTYLNYHASFSLIHELLYTCCSTGFSECTIKEDPEYRSFDKMKHDFEGEHSYVLVRTNNLPNNLPDVYIEGINTNKVDDDNSQHHGDSSSEENRRRVKGEDDNDEEDDDDDDDGDDDHKDDDDSEEHGEHHRLKALKIRVYNHTVEFKKKRRLIVSIQGIFDNALLLSHFPVVHFQHSIRYCHYTIISH